MLVATGATRDRLGILAFDKGILVFDKGQLGNSQLGTDWEFWLLTRGNLVHPFGVLTPSSSLMCRYRNGFRRVLQQGVLTKGSQFMVSLPEGQRLLGIPSDLFDSLE
ncbi:hypothetical protein VNO77_34401 [Canavalia gladiata]|uniref:Uncharacterized protein n=1 Tax=Canavalia gladiata TaxID=3824 RepID=A0AAN9KGH0_CANGL